MASRRRKRAGGVSEGSTPAAGEVRSAPDGLTVLTTDDHETVVLAFSLPFATPSESARELSVTESYVLRELLLGRSNKEIAARRGVSARTVANQVASIFQKLGVSSRTELVTSAALLSRRRKPSAR